jgi:hypothetical protein
MKIRGLIRGRRHRYPSQIALIVHIAGRSPYVTKVIAVGIYQIVVVRRAP